MLGIFGGDRRSASSFSGCKRMRFNNLVAVLVVMAPSWGLTVPTTEDDPEIEILPPGYTELAYEPPPPGSYRLPPLGDAVDGAVLRADGTATTLHKSYGGRIIVLAFIYTTLHGFSRMSSRDCGAPQAQWALAG